MTVGALLSSATAHHRAGRLDEAERLYGEILARQPDHPETLHLMGVLKIARGQRDEGVGLIRRAIERKPDTAQFHSDLGNVLANAGDLEAAQACYRRVLDLEPNLATARTLAALLTVLGRHEESGQVREAYLRQSPEAMDFPVGRINAPGLGDPLHRNALAGAEVRPAWHVAHDVKYFPLHLNAEASLRDLVDQFILNERKRPVPVLPPNARLVTVGSCFAEHLRSLLMQRGLMSEHIHVPEGLNNSFALRDFFEWALTGKRDAEAYWYNRKDANRALLWQPDAEQDAFARALKSADGFVVTFGLSEVWRDKQTGGVFWRGVPAELFDPARHVLTMSDVDENHANMRRICDLVRAHCGDVPIVVTLSPVPLNASFGDTSCTEADCVSKSVLRVAIDRLMRDAPPGVFYWPSFEIVRWLGAHVSFPMFAGEYRGTLERSRFQDTRHVRPDVVACIVDAFIEQFFAADTKAGSAVVPAGAAGTHRG